METPLAKDGTSFSGDNGLSGFGTRRMTSNFDERCKFHVAKSGGFWESGTAPKSFPAAMEAVKVFCDGQGVRSGCKISHANAVGDKSLVCCDPGAELTKGLLEVGLEIIVKDIPVLTEDFLAE